MFVPIVTVFTQPSVLYLKHLFVDHMYEVHIFVLQQCSMIQQTHSKSLKKRKTSHKSRQNPSLGVFSSIVVLGKDLISQAKILEFYGALFKLHSALFSLSGKAFGLLVAVHRNTIPDWSLRISLLKAAGALETQCALTWNGIQNHSKLWARCGSKNVTVTCKVSEGG